MQAWFEQAGLVVPDDGRAPYWRVDVAELRRVIQELHEQGTTQIDLDNLGPEVWRWLRRGRLPLTIEHGTRVSDEPGRVADPSHFSFSLGPENSFWFERIREDPFQNR